MDWKTCLIRNQVLSLFLLLMISSCASAPIPKWDGKIFAGDSKTQSLVRAQSNETCKAGDPCFDDFIGISYSDFRSFYSTYVLGCKEWNSAVPMMSPADALARFRVIFADLEKQAATP